MIQIVQEARTEDEGDYKCVLSNEHGEVTFISPCFHHSFSNLSPKLSLLQVEYAFKFYVTVEGGMDFRAMLMKRKVNNSAKK